MGGGYLFPNELEEETMLSSLEVLGTRIIEEANKSPVSPTNKEEMFSATVIFTSDDTIWVGKEEMLANSTSLQHDYCNVIESAMEKYPKSIPDETLDSPPLTVIINNQNPSALINSVFESPAELIPNETLGSLAHTVTPISELPSTFMNSEGPQPELPNQTATGQASSKDLEVSLFQVMKIVSDKQDLSFVEKVHLPEEKILRLCNGIVPNSAENQYPDIRISFNSLNQQSLPTIGFYGDKRTMCRILKEMGVIDHSVHAQMEEDKFEPGLYVGLLKHYIIVFYWHQGIHLKDASRKQVSCNFVRYVVDLCDDVFVCVEEHNILGALSASVTTTSCRLKRTQRLKTSHVQNSENDVRVSPGFNLSIGRYISTTPPEGLAILKHNLFFVEGYHRCAFLTANYKQSRKYFSTQFKKVNVSSLLSELEQLSKDYDLDFTRLNNEEFISLLKNSALPEFQGYTDLENSIQSRRRESRKCNIQSKLNELEEQILQNFLQVLPEYCKFIRYIPNSTYAYGDREHIGDDEIPIQINRFQQLEHQMATILSGNSGKQKLVFTGAEIKFQPSTGTESEFIIEKYEKSSHMIFYEEDIILRPIGKGDNTNQKAKILPNIKDGSTRKHPVVSAEARLHELLQIELQLRAGHLGDVVQSRQCKGFRERTNEQKTVKSHLQFFYHDH